MAKKTGGASRVSEQITSEQALAFIRRLQEKFRKPPRTKAEKAALQMYLAQFRDAELKAVGSRVQKDLMFRPPRTIEADGFSRRRKATVRRGPIRKRK